MTIGAASYGWRVSGAAAMRRQNETAYPSSRSRRQKIIVAVALTTVLIVGRIHV